MSDIRFNEIEKPPGAPDVAPVDPVATDRCRERAYTSFESFLRSRIEQLDATRPSLWQRDYCSIEAYLRSIEPMRDRFKQMLQFWRNEPTERTPVRISNSEELMRDDTFIATRFELEILPRLTTYAIELTPTAQTSETNPPRASEDVRRFPKMSDFGTPSQSAGTNPPRPGLLIQHGYGGTPEMICGFTSNANDADYSYRSFGLRAVRRGFHVVAVHHPNGYGEATSPMTRLPSRFPRQPEGYGQNRLHRLAELCGGAFYGIAMLASSRGVDLLLSRGDVDPNRIGMYGLSQGGTSALYLPALDARIKASVAGAFFNHRVSKLIGPINGTCYLDWQDESQFMREIVSTFSDPDIVSLICPRAFAVEAGVRDSSVDFESVRLEFEKAREPYDRLGLSNRIEFIAHQDAHAAAPGRTFDFLEEQLRDATEIRPKPGASA